MTLHKAQGKTLKAVILALSTHQSQLDYCFIVVAISRLHSSEDT